MRSNIVRDPYAKWLDIPSQEQPPTHYRLLALKQGQLDAADVKAAARRQHQRLRQHLVGINNDKCVQLMKEVEIARRVLIDEDLRKQYDIELKQAAILAPVKRRRANSRQNGSIRRFAGFGNRSLVTAHICGRVTSVSQNQHTDHSPVSGFESQNGIATDREPNNSSESARTSVPSNGRHPGAGHQQQHGGAEDAQVANGQEQREATLEQREVTPVDPTCHAKVANLTNQSRPESDAEPFDVDSITASGLSHGSAPQLGPASPLSAGTPDQRNGSQRNGLRRSGNQRNGTNSMPQRGDKHQLGDRQRNNTDDEFPEDSRLTFLELVGVGKHTRVYRAFDRSAQRHVAVRELVSNDPNSETTFWNESRFLGGLRSEQVLAMYEVNPDRNWCVLELAEERLDERLKRQPLSADEAVELLVQITQALKHIHERGNLFGDLDPGSIYVTAGGRFKLGASSGFSESGEALIPRTTRKHIPPELISGDVFGKCGPQTDLYCLAHTVLESILGPKHSEHFKGINDNVEDTMAWMKWHSSSTVALPPIDEMGLGFPHAVASVLDRMLRKKVKLRIESAGEIIEELRPVALGDSTTNHAISAANAIETTAPEELGAVTYGAPPDLLTGDDDFDEPQPTWRDAEYWIALSKRPPVQIAAGMVVLLLLVAIVFWPQSDARATVLFESTPPGAAVLVDTEQLPGLTPLRVQLKPGRCRIQFQLDGYIHESEPVTVPQTTQQVTIKRVLKLAGPPPPEVNSSPARLPEFAGLQNRPRNANPTARGPSPVRGSKPRSPLTSTQVAGSRETKPQPAVPSPVPKPKLPVAVTRSKRTRVEPNARNIQAPIVIPWKLRSAPGREADAAQFVSRALSEHWIHAEPALRDDLESLRSLPNSDPRLDVAWALYVLRHQLKPLATFRNSGDRVSFQDYAIATLEAAVVRQRALNSVPENPAVVRLYTTPYRLLIQQRLTVSSGTMSADVNRHLQRAAIETLELLELVTSLTQPESRAVERNRVERGRFEDAARLQEFESVTRARCIDFAGLVFGILKGPCHDKTIGSINFEDCEARVRRSLGDDEFGNFLAASKSIARKYQELEAEDDANRVGTGITDIPQDSVAPSKRRRRYLPTRLKRFSVRHYLPASGEVEATALLESIPAHTESR